MGVGARGKVTFRTAAAATEAESVPRHPHLDATPTSAYLHLPFCKRKCFYCDFPVRAVGADLEAPHVVDTMREYVDTLISEVNATHVEGSQPLKTVFFGGGTPSLIRPELLSEVLDALRSRFGFAPDAEISMEADPGTFDAARLRAYMALGVTRFSVGVQAFDDELLEACGRSHSLAEVYAALDAVREADPPSWSLDLISGLPGLTPERWQQSLDEAVRAGPPHVSIYDLQIEESTPFAKWYDAGRLDVPQDDESATMYHAAARTLVAAGYEHYEVSNYARRGHRCAHNLVYWQVAPFYAMGLGATSHVRGARTARPRKMKEYTAWVERLAAEPGPRDVSTERCDDHMLDVIMLSLRLADGLNLAAFRNAFGAARVEAVARGVERAVNAGLAEALHEEEWVSGKQAIDILADCKAEALRLSDPEGLALSNDVISDVFVAFGDDLDLE